MDQFHPELMWTDLLQCAGKRRGSAAAPNVFLALRLGGRLRLLGRRLVSSIVPPDDRAQWRAENLAYVDALRGLNRAKHVHDLIQGKQPRCEQRVFVRQSRPRNSACFLNYLSLQPLRLTRYHDHRPGIAAPRRTANPLRFHQAALPAERRRSASGVEYDR